MNHARIWQAARNIAARIGRDHISVLAAGIAFYMFVAIPSMLTAIVSLYGLAFNPADVQHQLAAMQGVLPQDVIKVLSNFLGELAAKSSAKLGWHLALSFVVAVWSGQSAASAVIAALNAVNELPENRSLLGLYGAGFAVAASGIVFGFGATMLFELVPVVIQILPLPDFAREVSSLVRWPLLIVLIAIGIAAIYRFAPAQAPKDKWGMPGLLIAVGLWLVGSALFSTYVQDLSSYDRNYGPLGAIIVLLMWLYVVTYAVLLGAEINVEWGLRPTTRTPAISSCAGTAPGAGSNHAASP